MPEPGTGGVITRFHELRKEVKREKKLVRKEDERAPTLAELTLPEEELRRLKGIGIQIRKKLKVGKAGITEGIVNGIHERWRRAEVVKIRCEDICKLNMKRTHDILERKTGGLVIWRSGSYIILYRGANYKYPYFLSDNNLPNDSSHDASSDSQMNNEEHDGKEVRSSGKGDVKSAGPMPANKIAPLSLIQGVGYPTRVRFQLPGEAQLEEEADRLLDGLGPRFTDWWGYDPLPIDADLLPAVVPGYRRPFRLLPYGLKPKLTNDEMTVLRRLGRPLPCHFALGRNRKLQGLAASMIKLWEKCEIAKIAVKRGVQNTNSEMMAEELKNLTGGTLLSRDREFIVFYRGKDFLPPAVSSAIEARRKYGIHRGKQKIDHHRLAINAEESELGTSEHASDKDCDGTDDQKTNSLSKRRMLRSAEAVVERTNIKLSMALEKKERAEKLLAELEEAQIPQQPEIDKEGITEEERYMLRKVGLRMKPFLLLGRRGIFDGTVENMHLHWKYRELVKIISNGRSIEDIHGVARTLEAESGGILVAVERVSKGYAIIMYRGKNYKRPASLRPQTLLNKREAMKRSLEAQRRESLKLHVLRLTRNIDELKHQLVSRNKDKETNSKQLVDKSRLHLARERYGADVILIHSSDGMDSSRDSLQTSHNDKRIDFPSMCDSDTDEANPEPSSESVLKEIETNVLTDMNEEGECTTCSDDLVSQGQTSCYAIVNHEETMESSVKSSKNEFKPPVQRPVDTRSNEMPFRAAPLSNRERLLLRKQALRMKKRPVIAVGRSNIVTGVAKTIKAHFQKHPLAIVNVKGRAKGTSVQEVVFKLEQATGAVLVSQEPSKVILYRGWGAREENGRSYRMNRSDARKTSAGREGGPKPTVSPELRAAIRLECGLKSNQDKGADPN